MQERRSSIANALELRLSCTNPSSPCFNDLTHNLLMKVLVIYQWRRYKPVRFIKCFVFGKHWSLTDDLVSIWCNAICLGLFASNVITLDLSALIRSNPKYVWNGDKEIGQRMLMISVHLVDQTGVQCYPGRGTATHAATRYSLTSWLTIP